MAEKHTQNEGRLRRLFGTDKPEKSENLDMGQIFNNDDDASEPKDRAPLINDDREQDAASDRVQETQSASSEDAHGQTESEIERDAREYYNSNHSKSIEDKIRSIHENALHSYAKETEDSLTQENETPSLDDRVQQSGTEAEVQEEKTDSQPASEESTSVMSGETKNYDMSQLISILKGQNAAHDSDKDTDSAFGDDDETEKMPSDSELGLHDSELYDDVNEYYHDFEFTEKPQGAALFKSFRKSAVVSCLAVILTLLATVICIWFELCNAAGLPFSDMMHPGRYGRIYAMLSLQMLALCVFFNLDGLVRGIRKLSFKRPAPEAAAVLVTAVCVIHTVVSAITAYESTSYKTFCFAGCFMLLILSLNSFIKAYTRFKAFAMVLSKKPKLTTKPLDHLSEEYTAFAKYLSEESEALAVVKSDSVADFVKHTYTVPKATSFCNVLIYTILILSIAASVIGAFFLKMPAYDAFTGGVFVFLFSSPVSLLIATALPYFAASVKASKQHTSILGEAAGDFYENTGVISFDDTEVFPPKAVKVTSIKTYNEQRIDKVIVYMAKIFDKLGGPLSYVFASSLQDLPKNNDEVMVLETAPDGIHLKIADDDVLVGTGSYMRLYDIETPADSIDETEMRSLTSILFLVCNNQLAAKFYIRYTLNRKFEPILHDFYDAGVCCGVRTFDPGIDDQLIAGNLKGTNYPIHVIRKDCKSLGQIEESLPGSIISLSGIHNYLKTFILVDRLGGIYKTNTVMTILSALLGLVISMCLLFTGTSIALSALLLFQIFWLLPPFVISLLGK